MERIMIIGCGGAGKSTLARQLGAKLNLPVVHLDKLFWRPGWEQISREEFDRHHREALAQEKWIIDGNYDRTMGERAKYCDTIIYLDFSRAACMMGVAKRVLTSYGRVRPDMAEGCPERFDLEFIKWIWDFNKNNREKTYRILNEAEGKETVVLKNRRAVRLFLKSL